MLQLLVMSLFGYTFLPRPLNWLFISVLPIINTEFVLRMGPIFGAMFGMILMGIVGFFATKIGLIQWNININEYDGIF